MEENKTFKYLYPCLAYYGQKEFENIRSFIIIKVGIEDMINLHKGKNICILYQINLDIPYRDQKLYDFAFNNYLNWLKEQPFYVDDYLSSYINRETHMVVLKIPEIHQSSFDEFLNGKYSNMYNNYYINQYFKTDNIYVSDKNQRILKARYVLIKHKKAKEEFVYTINSHFDTDITFEEFEGELDFPPVLKEETFNFQ